MRETNGKTHRCSNRVRDCDFRGNMVYDRTGIRSFCASKGGTLKLVAKNDRRCDKRLL
jgi:hypothetical protein